MVRKGGAPRRARCEARARCERRAMLDALAAMRNHFACPQNPRAPSMQRSTARFLTTHTGSLPRPADLVRMMFAREEGVPVDEAALKARVRAAVIEIARRQAAAGIDVINDGEASKPSYATYIKDRLSGFGGQSAPVTSYRDLADFPELARRVFGDPGRSRRRTPGCD